MKFKLLALVILFVSTLANATQFKLGEHYTEVKTPFKTEKSVIEFFSFYCPHCYKQEPVMKNIIANLPSDVIFKKNHVDGMPGRNLEIEQALTKALITADILKVKQQITPVIFSYIHKNKANFNLGQVLVPALTSKQDNKDRSFISKNLRHLYKLSSPCKKTSKNL